MSGKSTLLRSIGINAVLAYAGAPVRARTLRLTPLALGASLALTDSLAEGRSKFLAEVERLSAIARLSATTPLLFLVDEIFSGTNSADRQAPPPPPSSTASSATEPSEPSPPTTWPSPPSPTKKILAASTSTWPAPTQKTR